MDFTAFSVGRHLSNNSIQWCKNFWLMFCYEVKTDAKHWSSTVSPKYLILIRQNSQPKGSNQTNTSIENLFLCFAQINGVFEDKRCVTKRQMCANIGYQLRNAIHWLWEYSERKRRLQLFASFGLICLPAIHPISHHIIAILCNQINANSLLFQQHSTQIRRKLNLKLHSLRLWTRNHRK